MAVNGIGRPSKGHRIRVTTRVDPATHLLVVRAAQRDKVTVSEWVEKAVTASVAPLRDDGRHRASVSS